MSKEHSYAYEAGYRDGAINYELDHCPACKNVADLQEALEENAKLREELEQWHRLTAGIELPEYPITEFKPKDLERENAELRELVRAAWRCIHSGLSCSDCRLVAGGCTLQSAMRERGVEVDG